MKINKKILVLGVLLLELPLVMKQIQAAKTGWYLSYNSKTKKSYYFYYKNGIKKTGWITLNGKIYYIDKYYGRLTGKQTINRSQYYFNSAGVRQKGWIKDGKYLTYFYWSNGQKAYNTKIKNGNVYYAVDKYGYKITNPGVYTLNNKMYYVSSNTTLAVNKWISVGTKKYYASGYSELLKNTWKTLKNNIYYFNSYGNPVTGKQTINKAQYYFNSLGVRQKGWIKDGNYLTYYFWSSGQKAYNTKIKYGNVYYAVDSYGHKITSEGFVTLGNNRYYVSSDTTLYKDKLFTVNGNTYYADPYGNILRNTSRVINNVYYVFDANGFASKRSGLMTRNGNDYFYNNDGTLLTNSFKTIDGKKYYFNESGIKVKSDTIIAKDGKAYSFKDNGELITKFGESYTNAGLTWNYTPARSDNYGSYRPISNVKAIVIHYTGNAKDTASSNATYFSRDQENAGAHFFVDAKGVYMSTPLDHVSWSVGRLINKQFATYWGILNNSNTINIEIADDAGNYLPSKQSVNNAITLTRYLMKKYNISLVVRHKDVCGKKCPNYWFEDDIWKKEFLDRL